MTMIMTVMQLETAINTARKLDPPKDFVLSRDVAVMAEVYATMIYGRLEEIDLGQVADYQRVVLVPYLPALMEAQPQ